MNGLFVVTEGAPNEKGTDCWKGLPDVIEEAAKGFDCGVVVVAAPNVKGELVVTVDVGCPKGFDVAPNAVAGGVESSGLPKENDVETTGAEDARAPKVKPPDDFSSNFAANGLRATPPAGGAG